MNDNNAHKEQDLPEFPGNAGQHSPVCMLVDGIRLELDRSCDALDGYTLSRLNAIRHQALEHKRARRSSRSPLMLLPLGGLVTACVLVLAVSLVSQRALLPAEGVPAPTFEDLDLLATNEGLEFYEDYEFYQWLAGNE